MREIKLSDYHYNLPPEKIATHGIKNRDQSKLLLYKDREISHTEFTHLPDHLPANSTLFFNNTKVIQARLFLKRATGAIIEVFLLSPADSKIAIIDTLSAASGVSYTCMIGNLKKWQDDEVLHHKIDTGSTSFDLEVRLLSRERKEVAFYWNSPGTTFGAILEVVGHTPLPPYIKREDEEEDKQRYQTVYSKLPGAVAAPTAGLHFTDNVLSRLEKNGTKTHEITLHVSAGTFQPIKEEVVTEHPMHREEIIIYRETLDILHDTEYIIAVGTTALRTLESAYWFGVKLLTTNETTFHIEKLMPYSYHDDDLPSLHEALKIIAKHMDDNKLSEISGSTEIFIMPGYKFKVCHGLITNFHQPGSTLILLIAAFVGNDWRNIYKYAIENEFSFLSYGDSSLILT